jgi:hypothetical protein
VCAAAVAVFYIIYCLPAGIHKDKHNSTLPGYKAEPLSGKDVATKDATDAALANSPSAEMELAQSAPSASK